jgi:hypothetical protein
MPTIYLKRLSTGEVLDRYEVTNLKDPIIPKIIDGFYRMARDYGGPDVIVDDSEVNPRRRRKGPPEGGEPKGWEAGLSSVERDETQQTERGK